MVGQKRYDKIICFKTRGYKLAINLKTIISIMKKIYFIFLLIIFLTVSCKKNNEKIINVLLIGNSSIYYNNMPKMLESIAYENGVFMKTKLVAKGGYSLQDHWDKGGIEKVLDSLDWDYVILNEQSAFGEAHLVNGEFKVKESLSFYETVRNYDSKIRKKETKMIVLSLYPKKRAPNTDREILDYSYMKIAKELNILIAPVSYVWQDYSNNNNNNELYNEDNSHPSAIGSFITANVLFSTITRDKSVSFSKEIFGPFIQKNGVVYQDSIVSLLNMDKTTSSLINEVTEKQIKKLNNSGGYFEIERPNMDSIFNFELPADNEEISYKKLTGQWAGETKLYFRRWGWPAPLSLKIGQDGELNKRDVVISFSGNRDNLLPDVDGITLHNGYFEFVDKDGPNGGIVKYTGIIKNDSIYGLSELIVEGRPMDGIGTWSATKVKMHTGK